MGLAAEELNVFQEKFHFGACLVISTNIYNETSIFPELA